jgi:hypothetical protein
VKAVVVYESLWGNTAAIAHAVAEGLGPGVPAFTTDQATGPAIEGVDLVVVGAPVLGFALPTERMRAQVGAAPGKAPAPPDLSHPSMRSWLDRLPAGHGRAAAFETRIWWSPRGATGSIGRALEKAGYRRISEGRRFVVTGTYGPLRAGELERARDWGAELARLMAADTPRAPGSAPA